VIQGSQRASVRKKSKEKDKVFFHPILVKPKQFGGLWFGGNNPQPCVKKVLEAEPSVQDFQITPFSAYLSSTLKQYYEVGLSCIMIALMDL